MCSGGGRPPTRRRAQGSRRPPCARATSLGKQEPDPAGRPRAYSAVELQQAEHGQRRRAGDLPACGRSSSSPLPSRAAVRRPVRMTAWRGRGTGDGRRECRPANLAAVQKASSREATRAPPRGAHLGLGEAAGGVDGEHQCASRPLARGPRSPIPRGRENQPPGWMHEGMQEAAGKPLLQPVHLAGG
jgi:hypothetical protein